MAFVTQKRRDLRDDAPRTGAVQHCHVVAGHFDKATVHQPRDRRLRLLERQDRRGTGWPVRAGCLEQDRRLLEIAAGVERELAR